MQFIEMTGKQLLSFAEPGEMDAEGLKASGIGDETIVRVNQQGDLEARQKDGWSVFGGLLGDFQQRVTQATGLDWADPLSTDS
ncbi:MAG: hypothetical protein AAGA92_03820 [Planctomycetota bacterium]